MLIINDNSLGKPKTPAHDYVYQSDFAKILEDIDRGIIPCGSGQPFPLEFQNPDDDIVKMDSFSNRPAPTAVYNNTLSMFGFGNLGR